MKSDERLACCSARRDKLLRGFDRAASRAFCCLSRRWGPEFADAAIRGTRAEFQRLIPDIPYIGGWRNVFSWVMTVNGWIISLHRSMRGLGATTEDVIQVCIDFSDDFLGTLPKAVRRLTGRLAFTRPMKLLLKWQARRSQLRRYPQDFVFSVVDDDAGQYTLSFEERAVMKFYASQQVEELMPYCNFFDVVSSRALGLGLDASETIGLGRDTCLLRYKRGVGTVTPASLARFNQTK